MESLLHFQDSCCLAASQVCIVTTDAHREVSVQWEGQMDTSTVLMKDLEAITYGGAQTSV